MDQPIAERALAALVDDELKRCLDHAAEGLHWVGPDGTILWANQTELEMLGYARDEYIGHHIAEFHADPPVIADILASLSRGDTLLGYNARLRHRDGSIRTVQINSNVRFEGERFLHTRCFTRDVTDERKAGELAMRLASIVEHSVDAIYSHDEAGCVTSWNPAAERMYGYAAADAIGQSLRLIIPPELWDEEQDVLARVWRGERVEPYETVRVCKDGRRLDVALTASAIRSPEGTIVGVSKLARDITARKRLEARDAFLVNLDDTLRPLTEAADITLTAASALGRHLGVNRCAYATVEDDQDTFILTGNYNDGVPGIVGRYTFRQFGEECVRLLRAGAPYVVSDANADPRIAAADRPSYGATAIRAVTCVPILKQQRLVAAMAVHSAVPRQWDDTDVELVQRVASRCWESIERARVTGHLRESERQFRDLANSIANLAWMARPDGWIYWYNDKWYEYTGTTPHQMEGWGWQRVHDPAVLADVVARWRQSIATGEPFEMVFPLRGVDGQFRRFLTRVNPVRDADGNVVRWFGTNTDVEAERRATEANNLLRAREQAARREAESANRAKDEFLAMLGHELRNPLSPILTALQLMKLRGGDADERERVVIERQVRHLTRLVDDLLDVSRIARGKVELKREVFEIVDVVAKAIEMASPLLEERTHTLHVDVPRRGLAVTGDSTRLSQVLANLLTNAAKYTGQGGDISVAAAREGEEVVVRVRDNGIGIAPDVLPHVFDLFVQERQAIDRAQGGLGLGLTIVRSLVKRHGGTVVASSAGTGKGSEFVVRLPRTDSAVRSETGRRLPVDASAAPRVGRVLVVDDNADAADMLVQALTAHGYTAQAAYDAPQALRLAGEVRPDVAFVDIGLPVMDGYELAAQLRQDPALARMRLIAVTGYGQASDRARALAAGFETHLVKPVEWEAIAGLLDAHATTGRQ